MTSQSSSTINNESISPLLQPSASFIATHLHSFRIGLWNANGLRASVIHDVLSHAQSFDILFITETWLTAGNFPCNWEQFHLYGAKVANANNRGSGGVSALVNPTSSLSVHRLPSSNRYTLSIKTSSLSIHCLYLPPSLSTQNALHALQSIPLRSDTIICGDLNARLGDFTGDSDTNPRGRALLPWLEEAGLEVLNSSLAFGAPTLATSRRGEQVTSIIDLFLSNIGTPSAVERGDFSENGLVSPSLTVEQDLALGSDHLLMHLSFSYIPRLASIVNDGASTSVWLPGDYGTYRGCVNLNARSCFSLNFASLCLLW